MSHAAKNIQTLSYLMCVCMSLGALNRTTINFVNNYDADCNANDDDDDDVQE